MCTNNIDDLKEIIGSELLEMEEKEKFIDGVENSYNELLTKDDLEQFEYYKIEGIKETCTENGIKLGIEQGIEQGTYQKQVEVTENMYKKSMDLDTISEVTNLSIDEIKDILKLK